MYKSFAIGAVLSVLLCSAASAQVKVDMTKVTCSQVLAMSPADEADFAAWMSGWYAQKSGRTFIDLAKFHQNFDSVVAWCGSNPSESVMAGLQRAFDKK